MTEDREKSRSESENFFLFRSLLLLWVLKMWEGGGGWEAGEEGEEKEEGEEGECRRGRGRK